MHGRTVVITGGNAGIGKATATALARQGARVIITARQAERGENAVAEIIAKTGNSSVDWMCLDLADFASVRTFAADLLRRVDGIDVLDCNAGGILAKRQVTADGIEAQFQVNHLSHFLLTNLLLDCLRASVPARIVVLSSWGHTQAKGGLDFDDLQWERRAYRASAAYSASKLMNLLFTFELARRLDGSGVTANALHPGWVATEFAQGGDTFLLGIGTMLGRFLARTPERGAQTAVWLAASPDAAAENGGYFIDCRRKSPAKPALDTDAARRLWEVSAQLTGVG